MSARDIFHNAVKRALIKAGWTVTHDPLRLQWAMRNVYIDLGAEQLLAAQQGEKRIAVEIKSFIGPSDIASLEQALGQYIFYHDILEELDPARMLFLAIPQAIYDQLFEAQAIGAILLRKGRLRLVLFEAETEEITQWIE